MKHTLVALAAAVLFVSSGGRSSAAEPASGAAPAGLIEGLPRLLGKTGVAGVAIARIENGRVAWTAVAGERAPGLPLTADTVFNVASLTKPAFALMVLKQVADGRLGLDQPLADSWVDPDVADDPRHLALTPRILLSHQGGFPNWRGDQPLRFDFAPGARHEYSGEGYEYLRRALERSTGRSLRELMQASVLEPLAMGDTAFGWSARFEQRTASGFRSTGHAYPGGDLPQRTPSAAANMLTTIGDYGRFAAWVARGADLPPALFQDMQRPQALHEQPAEQFGLGWRLLDVDGTTVLSHDGREPGVRTQVFVLPASAEALVVLTSSDNGELLTRPLAAALLPRGQQLLASIDRDIWTFLQRMPVDQVAGVARMVAGSPSFMSKFLHAVDEALIAHSDLPAAERASARAAVDAYVGAMQAGEIDRPQAEALVGLLRNGEQGWHAAFSSARQREWIAALVERTDGAAGGNAVEVPPARLAAYAGSYRVPSSQLLVAIRHDGGGLQATAEGMPVITLHAQSQTMFVMREDDTRFEFQLDAADRVTGVRLLWSGGRSELAPRVQ